LGPVDLLVQGFVSQIEQLFDLLDDGLGVRHGRRDLAVQVDGIAGRIVVLAHLAAEPYINA
jgi:hypothetical protein